MNTFPHQFSSGGLDYYQETLSAEFINAKQILSKGIFWELPDAAVSAKMILTIKHNQQTFTHMGIMTPLNPLLSNQDITDLLLSKVNDLFKEIEKNIQFDKSKQTEFKLGILIKSSRYCEGSPVVACLLQSIDVLAGKVFNLISRVNCKLKLTEKNQRKFCKKMDVPFTAQLNAENHFV